jgi:hypothetical protein
VECFEDGGGGGIAPAEFAGEIEGAWDSEAGEIRLKVEEVEAVEERAGEIPPLRRAPLLCGGKQEAWFQSGCRGCEIGDVATAVVAGEEKVMGRGERL